MMNNYRQPMRQDFTLQFQSEANSVIDDPSLDGTESLIKKGSFMVPQKHHMSNIMSLEANLHFLSQSK
jgi:hypothetical protein